MKKKLTKILGIGLVLALLVSLLLIAAPVAAAKESSPSLGAVKLLLFEREEGYDPNDEGAGDLSGWAIVNTNADGILNVEVHLDDNDEPKVTFSVFVKIDWDWNQSDVVQLVTNRRGKGNAHVQLDIADYSTSTDTIMVQVVVRVDPGPPYLPGYASGHVPVPLK